MSAPKDSVIAPFPVVFDRLPSRFKRESFNSVSIGSYRWLVKNLLPEVGVCFLGGPSGSGKTFFALDMVTRICRGLPVLGRRTASPAGAVYVGAEDAAGIRLRMAGLREEIGQLDGDCLELIGQAPDLTDPEDVQDLRGVLEASRDDMLSRGIRLGLVVIDTMSASTPGADENTGRDMQPVLNDLEKLAQDLNLLVLMVAHTGKNPELGLRGWSGLRANTPGLIMLEERDSGGVGGGTVVKVKNGRDGDRFGFRLRKIVLDYDDDGDEITTCLIDECEAPVAPKAGRNPTKASVTADLIMTAYGRALEDNPERISAPGAAGLPAVKLDNLRTMAYRIGVGGGEAEIPPEADDAERARLRRKWHDQRKADFKRGLEHLIGLKKLRTEAGYVWEVPNKKSPL